MQHFDAFDAAQATLDGPGLHVGAGRRNGRLPSSIVYSVNFAQENGPRPLSEGPFHSV